MKPLNRGRHRFVHRRRPSPSDGDAANTATTACMRCAHLPCRADHNGVFDSSRLTRLVCTVDDQRVCRKIRDWSRGLTSSYQCHAHSVAPRTPLEAAPLSAHMTLQLISIHPTLGSVGEHVALGRVGSENFTDRHATGKKSESESKLTPTLTLTLTQQKITCFPEIPKRGQHVPGDCSVQRDTHV